MLIYAKLLLTAFFWGGTFIAGRIVAQHAGPFSAAFLRFVVASTILFFFNCRQEGRLPTLERRHLLPVLLLGLTGIFLYNVFFFSGLQRIQAGRAALIIATNPIVIALFSACIFKEKLQFIQGIGIVLSVAGAAAVITNGNFSGLLDGHFGIGESCILGCVLSWAAFSLIGKTVMTDLSPLAAITWAAVAGTILLIVPALSEGILRDMWRFTPVDWLSIGYLGFFGTALGFVWYYEGISQLGPAAASQFINFVPVSAVVLAFLVLDEPITASLLIGAVCVSLGVYLVRKSAHSTTRR